LDGFPLVELPVPISDHPALGGLAWQAAERLLQRFPPLWPGPFTPLAAQSGLTSWCLELAELIADSSRLDDIDEDLASSDAQLVARQQRWLDGQWSGDCDALMRLCCQIGLSHSTISGAVWLHRFGQFYRG
jgi:hypothetical protein